MPFKPQFKKKLGGGGGIIKALNKTAQRKKMGKEIEKEKWTTTTNKEWLGMQFSKFRDFNPLPLCFKGENL